MANLNLYEFYVNGEKWNSPEERYLIESDTPRNALTKLRILHGESVYRRCYMVFGNDKNPEYASENIKELFSYGMLREQLIRDFGRKYYYKVLSRRKDYA